jgi:hypothetical protein
MPSVAIAVVISEKGFQKQQANARISDSKGNVIYTPIITISGSTMPELRVKAMNSLKKFLDAYEETQKRLNIPDLVKTPSELFSKEEIDKAN